MFGAEKVMILERQRIAIVARKISEKKFLTSGNGGAIMGDTGTAVPVLENRKKVLDKRKTLWYPNNASARASDWNS